MGRIFRMDFDFKTEKYRETASLVLACKLQGWDQYDKIERYLAGELSSEDTELLREELSVDPEVQQTVTGGKLKLQFPASEYSIMDFEDDDEDLLQLFQLLVNAWPDQGFEADIELRDDRAGMIIAVQCSYRSSSFMFSTQKIMGGDEPVEYVIRGKTVDGKLELGDNKPAEASTEATIAERLPIQTEAAMVPTASDIPIAEPQEGQHNHLDFLNKARATMSVFGGLIAVNATGTEYSLCSISSMTGDEGSIDISAMIDTITQAARNEFGLADTAKTMAELFRVNAEAFDASHDREQEILNGLIQRASIYNTFRSFAWTLQAYCEKEGVVPSTLPFDTVQELVAFISDRGGLNYTANSFSSELCSGDDLNVYYIPDSVPELTKNQFIESLNEAPGTENTPPCGVKSLDGLRRELEYMYPAIRTIYDELEKNRNRDEALVDGVADILYAWCSMTYAAREPIFSEDGPVNCLWGHPDTLENLELKMKTDWLENTVKKEMEWLNRHKNDLETNPSITIKDKLFVFTGVKDLDEWPAIQQSLADKGGILRTTVSGKTDYLVCNPAYAGEAQIKRVQEQKVKGKYVKVILFEDFLKALNMTVKTPQEELAELTSEKKVEKTDAPEEKLEPVDQLAFITTEDGSEKASSLFTYNQGIRLEFEDYSIAIPDGFRWEKGLEGRDFVAWLPGVADSYLMSKVILYAGQLTPVESDERIDYAETLAAKFEEGHWMVKAAQDQVIGKSTTWRLGTKNVKGMLFYNTGHYQISLAFPQNLKQMRVSVYMRRNKEMDQAVEAWLDTIVLKNPFPGYQSVCDKKYLAEPLSPESIARWEADVKHALNQVVLMCRMYMFADAQRYQYEVSCGKGSETKLHKWVRQELKQQISLSEKILEDVGTFVQMAAETNPAAEVLQLLSETAQSFLQWATADILVGGTQLKLVSTRKKELEAHMIRGATQIKAANKKNNKQEAVPQKGKKSAAIKKASGKEVAKKDPKEAEEARLAQKEKEAEKQRIKDEKAQAAAEKKERRNILNKEKRSLSAAYKRECAKIHEARQARLQEETDRKREDMLRAVHDEFDASAHSLENQLAELNVKLNQTQESLAQLGILQVLKKKALRDEITCLQAEAHDLQDQIAALPDQRQKALIEAEENLNKQIPKIQKAIEEELSLPKDPVKYRNKLAILTLLKSEQYRYFRVREIIQEAEDILSTDKQAIADILEEMYTKDKILRRIRDEDSRTKELIYGMVWEWEKMVNEEGIPLTWL